MCCSTDSLQVTFPLLVQPVHAIFEKLFAEAVYGAQRRLQVMGNRVAERLQLKVCDLQFVFGLLLGRDIPAFGNDINDLVLAVTNGDETEIYRERPPKDKKSLIIIDRLTGDGPLKGFANPRLDLRIKCPPGPL